jgi:hypothetical protein
LLFRWWARHRREYLIDDRAGPPGLDEARLEEFRGTLSPQEMLFRPLPGYSAARRLALSPANSRKLKQRTLAKMGAFFDAG